MPITPNLQLKLNLPTPKWRGTLAATTYTLFSTGYAPAAAYYAKAATQSYVVGRHDQQHFLIDTNPDHQRQVLSEIMMQKPSTLHGKNGDYLKDRRAIQSSPSFSDD